MVKNSTKAKQSQSSPAMELETFEERRVRKGLLSKKGKQIKKIVPVSENSSDSDESMHSHRASAEDDLKQAVAEGQPLVEKDIDYLCETKINSKNAFNVPFINMEKSKEFWSKGDDQYVWKKLASILENDSTIYGYRVEAVHSDAFRMISSMMRRSEPLFEVQEDSSKDKSLGTQLSHGIHDEDWEKFLCTKNHEAINNAQIDRAGELNPILEKTKRMMDQSGVKSMLLGTLSLSTALMLMIHEDLSEDKKKPIPEAPLGLDIPSLLASNSLIPETSCQLTIMRSIQQFCKSHCPTDLLYPNQRFNSLEWISVQTDNNDRLGELENEDQSNYNGPSRQLISSTAMILMKSKKKGSQYNLRQKSQWSYKDEEFLDQKDKKILGMSKGESRVEKGNQDKKEIKIWYDDEILERRQILKKTREEQRGGLRTEMMEKEEVDDMRLVPMRPVQEINFSIGLMLRDDPVLPASIEVEEAFESPNIIDVRRQQLTIMDLKIYLQQALKSPEQKSFSRIYGLHQEYDHLASPALCFLTLLHLTNQNFCHLDQSEPFDLIIR